MKYTILQMLRDLQDKDPRGLATRSAKSNVEIASVWGVAPSVSHSPPVKRCRLSDIPAPYHRNHFTKLKKWPKFVLETFFREHFGKKFTKPTYEVTRRDKDGRFTAKMTIEIEKRRKTFQGGFERNKKEAEQAAALQAVLTRVNTTVRAFFQLFRAFDFSHI